MLRQQRNKPSLRRSAQRPFAKASVVVLTLTVLSLLLSLLAVVVTFRTGSDQDASLSWTTHQRLGTSKTVSSDVTKLRQIGHEYERCEDKYNRMNTDRIHGLSSESLERSRAWIGNRYRHVHSTKETEWGYIEGFSAQAIFIGTNHSSNLSFDFIKF